jgi:hypothetical protein
VRFKHRDLRQFLHGSRSCIHDAGLDQSSISMNKALNLQYLSGENRLPPLCHKGYALKPNDLHNPLGFCDKLFDNTRLRRKSSIQNASRLIQKARHPPPQQSNNSGSRA